MSVSIEVTAALIASEIISLTLLIFLWRGQQTTLSKVLLSVLVLIPIAGPILYLFGTVMSSTPAQDERFMNHGPRGEYFHSWITMEPIFKKFIEEKKSRVAESRKDDT